MDRFLAHKEMIDIQEAFEAEAYKSQMKQVEEQRKHGSSKR